MSMRRDAWDQIVLPLVVMCLLRRRPSHGYELLQRLQTNGFDGVRGSALYPLLHRLEASSFVEWSWTHPTAGPARKTYRVTEAGHHLAATLAADWQQASAHMDRFLERTGDKR